MSNGLHSSRLYCERCHGIGYVITALGKLPCLTCSASEFVGTGQNQSGVVNSDPGERRRAGNALSLQGLAPSCQKNFASFSCRSFLSVFLRRCRHIYLATIKGVAIPADREPASPFAGISTVHYFDSFNRNYEFIFFHFGTLGKVRLLLGRLPKEWNENFTVALCFVALDGQRFRFKLIVASNHQEMSGEQG